MTRAYGGLVAGLAVAAMMGAGARLEPVEEDFGSRRPSVDPDPEPKSDRSGAEPVETPIDPVEPPNDGEGIPNRLSIQRDSRYYTSAGSFIGLIFNGEDVTGRVVEFDREGGWARLVDRKLSGTALSRYQVESAAKAFGKVQPFWRAQPSRQIRRQLARIA